MINGVSFSLGWRKSSGKTAIGILTRTALGSISTWTILSLTVHEYGVSFYLLVSSSISFSHILQFSVYKSLTSLVQLTPKYFILFDVIANGIVFLLSFFWIVPGY